MMKEILRWGAILGALLAIGIVGAIGVGASLPVAHTASVSDTLDTTVEAVWQAITDPERFPEWRSGVEGAYWVETAEGAPRRWREEASSGSMTFEIEEWRPETLLKTRIADEDLPFGGSWSYALRSVDSRVEVTLTENGEVYSPIFRFVSRFVIGHERTMRTYLDDLTRHLGGSP